MSKKQWMVLLMLFLTYLLLGASIFYHIESRLEIERVEKVKRERIEINALLRAHYAPSRVHDHDEILGKLTRYCGKSVYNYTDGETDPLKWDFYNSFYFAYTVVSTIGYGNLAPTNTLGRILMIFYGLIGIPINGILLTQLGEFFGHAFVKAHRKYKSYKLGGRNNDRHQKKSTTFETRKVGLAVQIFVYLIPGFVMFIFFPAFLFSHYEGWSYDEAVYYAFVTLTTIGFGDYVAGQDNSKGSGVFFVLYKSFLICWISFGLGYIVMIMTFIARGMRSKKIARIEHKLAINLKHTQSKIWNEFNKEMNYLRRVFNELQLSKVKRIYVDERDQDVPPAKFPRSNSFPDLRGLSYGAKGNDGIRHGRSRRRANSEIAPTMEDRMARVVSDTDLQRIDKTATFATHAMIQPAELLARLVNILGYIPPATEDIVDGDFSTRSTLVDRRSRVEDNNDEDHRYRDPSEEEESIAGCAQTGHGIGRKIWTIGNERISRTPRPRSRATSEIRLYENKNEDRNVEWTWSDPAASRKIQELMKARRSAKESPNKDRRCVKEAKFSKFRKALVNRFSTTSERKGSEKFEDRKTNDEDIERRSFAFDPTRLEPDDDDDDDDDDDNDDNEDENENEDKKDNRRNSNSTFISRRHYYTHTGATDVERTESGHLLEETSLADFLRALTFLHATVANTDGNVWTTATANNNHVHRTRPRRKMGTASLTPPKLPSLFTLFSSPSSQSSNAGTTAAQSYDNDATTTTTTTTTGKIAEGFNGGKKLPSFIQIFQDKRRNSSTPVGPTTAKPRRFSLRPVATPVSPPTPPANRSPFSPSSDSRRTAYENKEATFSFESPNEPLIRTEGAPGRSSPMKISSVTNGRRSSLLLRPCQNHSGISGKSGTTAAVASPSLKGTMPRWKAGMLQRQIGETNLRRRARAFSLSDVRANAVLDEKTESPLFDPSSSIIVTTSSSSSSNSTANGGKDVVSGGKRSNVSSRSVSISRESESSIENPQQFAPRRHLRRCHPASSSSSSPSTPPPPTPSSPSSYRHSDRRSKKRSASFSRESVSNSNLRFVVVDDERGIFTIDSHARSIGNDETSNDDSNERASRSSFDAKERIDPERAVVESDSTSFESSRGNAKDRPSIDEDREERTASSFVAINVDAQQSLTEVKIENPVRR